MKLTIYGSLIHVSTLLKIAADRILLKFWAKWYDSAAILSKVGTLAIWTLKVKLLILIFQWTHRYENVSIPYHVTLAKWRFLPRIAADPAIMSKGGTRIFGLLKVKLRNISINTQKCAYSLPSDFGELSVLIWRKKKTTEISAETKLKRHTVSDIINKNRIGDFFLLRWAKN